MLIAIKCFMVLYLYFAVVVYFLSVLIGIIFCTLMSLLHDIASYYCYLVWFKKPVQVFSPGGVWFKHRVVFGLGLKHLKKTQKNTGRYSFSTPVGVCFTTPVGVWFKTPVGVWLKKTQKNKQTTPVGVRLVHR